MPRSKRTRCILLVLLAAALRTPAGAQDGVPRVRGLLTGYGSVAYTAQADRAFANDFTATLAPVLLYQVGDDVLLEGEIELELEGGGTEAHLEHAQIHYLGFEHIRFTAGMLHLPFGVWMHANWVNRMPTPPLLYGDTHGQPAEDVLMPIPFDVGLKASADFRLTDRWRTSATLWVSQGPASGIEPHVHGGEPQDTAQEPEPASNAPPLGYGANFEDNNSDKMVGLRLRLVSAGGLTLQTSGFRARYDEAGELGIHGLNLSAILAPGTGPDPLFDLRAEGVLLRQEYVHHDVVEVVRYGGHYVQLSRRMGAFEPVVRWSRLPRAVAGHGSLVERRRQVALGMNYWIAPSVPVKVAYDIEMDGTDGFFLEWAMGF